MSVSVINQENFEQEVSGKEGLVVLDFYADWCGPCKQLGPVIDQLAGEYTNVKFGKVNIDNAPELAKKFGVRNIPNLVFIKNGEQIDRSIGNVPKQNLEDIIKKHS